MRICCRCKWEYFGMVGGIQQNLTAASLTVEYLFSRTCIYPPHKYQFVINHDREEIGSSSQPCGRHVFVIGRAVHSCRLRLFPNWDGWFFCPNPTAWRPINSGSLEQPRSATSISSWSLTSVLEDVASRNPVSEHSRRSYRHRELSLRRWIPSSRRLSLQPGQAPSPSLKKGQQPNNLSCMHQHYGTLKCLLNILE